ncbi:MAG: iron-sulfur cluster repair di-iron protein [Actinomycetota bacterium]|jgi:regulator of cell morphogenesis and NO signaling|nr:iron-sulfur cluster repair di-iron protein [Actinomycetota bacterium]
MLSTETTVGQLVTERPSRAKVFEVLGIDYCCSGNRPLGEVCVEKGLDATTVLRMLDAHESGAGAEDDRTDWSEATITGLTDHIVEVHHGYLNEALPRLEALVNKVAVVHGGNHPELRELRRVYGLLKPDLEAHLQKEEEVLFPMCRELEGAEVRPDFHCSTVDNPIGVMVQEHEEAGKALATMRELTSGFEPPEGACNTYRTMLDGLAELERDVHLHVHKENNILFPKASAAEAALPARP